MSPEYEEKMRQEFGLVLVALRIRAKLSQRHAAERLRAAHSFLGNLETCQHLPILETLCRMAPVYGLVSGWAIVKLIEARLLGEGTKLTLQEYKLLFLSGAVSSAPAARQMTMAQAFASTVKAARVKRGMIAADLARKMKWNQSQLSKIENAHCVPGLVLVFRLAEALDTPAWNLVRCAEIRMRHGEELETRSPAVPQQAQSPTAA